MTRPPIRLLALALLLIGAIAAPVAGAHGRAITRTKVVTVTPVDATGALLPGYHVVERYAKGSCEIGSDVLAGAYRCFDRHFVADPCWPTGRFGSANVVCLKAPWSKRLLGLVRPTGVGAIRRHYPPVGLGLMLADGTHCDVIETGSSIVASQRIDYGCSASDALIGEPKRTDGLWTITKVRYSSAAKKTVVVGRVRIAIFYQGSGIVWK